MAVAELPLGRSGLQDVASHIRGCHHPRKRMIQYSAMVVFNHWRRGILGRPVKPGDDGGVWGCAS